MKKTILVYFILMTCLSLSAQTTTIERKRFDGTTSLIELIASGEKYDQKNVLIKGYFVDDQRRGRLFLSQDDAQYGILGNSIIIEYNSIEGNLDLLRSMNNKYICIEGIFYFGLGRQEVGLSNISRFYKLDKVKNKGN